jgi:cytidylate kinase
MAVITISRQFGAGGWTLGGRLAKRLGYRFVNEDMIKEVAAKIGASTDQIIAFEKAGGSKLMKFLDKLVSKDFIDRLITDKYAYVDQKGYVDVVRGVVEDLHRQGNVVIIGRGSQYILKDREDTRHILLVQDLETRVRFMMEKYKLSRSEAERAIRQRDQTRHQFLGFFSDEAFHDAPITYDLVLNMNRMNMDKAEELVVELIS